MSNFYDGCLSAKDRELLLQCERMVNSPVYIHPFKTDSHSDDPVDKLYSNWKTFDQLEPRKPKKAIAGLSRVHRPIRPTAPRTTVQVAKEESGPVPSSVPSREELAPESAATSESDHCLLQTSVSVNQPKAPVSHPDSKPVPARGKTYNIGAFYGYDQTVDKYAIKYEGDDTMRW